MRKGDEGKRHAEEKSEVGCCQGNANEGNARTLKSGIHEIRSRNRELVSGDGAEKRGLTGVAARSPKRLLDKGICGVGLETRRRYKASHKGIWTKLVSPSPPSAASGWTHLTRLRAQKSMWSRQEIQSTPDARSKCRMHLLSSFDVLERRARTAYQSTLRMLSPEQQLVSSV